MIVLDGLSLGVGDVVAVARDGAEVTLAQDARARNEAAWTAIATRLARGAALYGATTGVGALRDRVIAEADREEYQWNLLRSHAVGAGRPLEVELVRAGMVVRANQLGGGGAGVIPALLDALVTALNEGVTPFVRELGSLGTGDLPALSEVALALLGEGYVWPEVGADPVPASTVAGPVRLGQRDAVSFTSSNAFTGGHAALLVADARALHDALLLVAALSFEALHADPVVLDERVSAARGEPGQVAVATRMRELLSGASLEPTAPDRLVQDPYPFRVLPQVEGVTYDALRALEVAVLRELNSRPENALIVGDGIALPNGNFYAAELATTLDGLRSSLAQSASLTAARVSAMIDPRMTGLAPFLARRPGLESGVMMLEYTAHSAAAEIRSLATPMATQSVWASLGVESHASLAATAARRTAQALAMMRILIATELVVVLRALDLSRQEPVGAGTRPLFARAREALPAGLEDRVFGLDVEAACRVIDGLVE